MKKLILMLAAALTLAPVSPTFADEAPAKPKKKLQMKTYMNQLDKAKADAIKNDVPILVFVILDGDEKSTLMKRYLFNNKIFKQLAQENFVKLAMFSSVIEPPAVLVTEVAAPAESLVTVTSPLPELVKVPLVV